MGFGKITKNVIVAAFAVFGMSGSFSVGAQQKGYVLDGSHEQVHALRENYGKGNLIGVKKDKLEFWYIVKDLNAKDWNVILTYPRWKEGMVDLNTTELPDMAAYYPWGGWAGIMHNDQLFYVSKFVPTYSERYGDYGDYDLFHSALSIATATYLTKNGVMHKAIVDKIGDYALSESDIRVIDVILYSDDNGGEDPDLEFGDYVFYNCRNFIGLPEGSPYKVIPNNVTKIGKGIFKDCSAMTRMIIGDKVSVIPEETFDGCTSLRELKLGASVKEIRCSISGLKRLAISAPTPPAIAAGCVVEAEEIWVPEQYLENYKTVWTGKNIKPYSFKFRANPVKAFAGYQADVRFERVSPGEGENNYVYCYPREKDNNGNQNYLWTVDATHGSNTASGKFKTVWYSYDCDKRKDLAAGNVVYEDLTRVRFDKQGTYKLYYTTLDITNHTEEVTVEVDPLPLDYVPVEALSITGGPNKHTLRVNGTDKLGYVISTPTQGGKPATYKTVTWSSSNPEIATVDENGYIAGIAPGKAVITATTTDPYVPEITATYTLNIIQRMESFILQANYGGVWEEIERGYGNKYSIEGLVGETLQIRPVCFPEGTSYTSLYISVDQFTPYPEGFPEVEIDDQTGTILLKSAGKAQLNVAVRDGDAGDAGVIREMPILLTCYDETATTTVSQILVKEVETGNSYNYSVGYTGEVTDRVALRVSYNGNAQLKQVKWECDKPDIAEIVPVSQVATLAEDTDPQYHFTLICKKPGTARLTATPLDGGYASASFPVTVNQPVMVSVPIEQTARVEDGKTDVKVFTNNFSFEIHNDATATLVYPSAGETNGLTSGGIPTTPYEFTYPGDVVYRNGDNNYVWSPYMDSVGYKNKDLYFTALKIPETIKVNGKEYTVNAIGDYAFAGSNVRCVHIPNTVTSIGSYAFKDAKQYKGLAEVSNFAVMPDAVTVIGKGIFSGCSAMEGMIIGNGLVEVPEETFDGCSSLKYLTIGTDVERIRCSVDLSGEDAVLSYTSAVPPVFDESCAFKTKSGICVPESEKSVYQAAFPGVSVKGLSIAVVPECTITYIGSPIRFTYDNTSSRNGHCNYMMFYPDIENPTGGEFTVTSEGSLSNDWISWSFDAVSAVKNASTIDEPDKQVSISFASEGEHKIYFHDLCVPAIVSEPISIEAVTGVAVTKINIDDVPAYLDVNGNARLSLTVLPYNATNKSILWVFDKEGIIEVDEKNNMTAVAPGTVKVKAVSTDPFCERISSVEYTVVVKKSVEDVKIMSDGVAVPSTGISGYPGEIIPLTAMVSPEDCDFESCDWSVTGDVCKVESDGFNAAVELLSPGKGTIMFVLNQIVGAKKLVKEIPVQVKAPVKEISIKIDGVAANPEKSLVDVTGAVYTVTAAPNSDAFDKRLIWEISNPEVVQLEVSGNDAILTFKKQGIAYLKISAADGRGASVAIGIGVKESGQPDPVIPAPETPEEPEDIKVEQLRLAITKHAGYPGDKLTLIVEVLPKNATDQTVLWTTSHSEIASVSDAGEINLLKEGNAVVTGTAADGSGVSVTCAIQVKSRPTSIDGIDNPNGKVSVEESVVIVQGINDGDVVSLYSAAGILIDRKRCVGDVVSFTVGAHGIYIVVTPAASFKIRY